MTIWHPYTQMATAPAPIAVERAEGAWLHTADGRSILDAISSWWVILHGHCNPRIAAAIARQAAALDQVILAGFTHDPAERLARELVGMTPPGLEHVFFSDDGSTAVEVALKMACQYWQNRGEPGRTRFVSLEGSYHGDTIGAMSVSGVDVFRRVFAKLLFDVERVSNPCLADVLEPSRRPERQIACAEELDGLLARLRGQVAAVILEPMIQGAGGMIIWPREFLAGARAACDRHDVLLIADEVFTGFGRTGKLFACEHGPVTPDILCLSKAITGGVLPLAATLTTGRVYDAFLSEDRGRTFFHGHSFTGNPIACAAALESIALLRDGGMERVGEIEAIHRARLEALAGRADVLDASCLGLVARIELRPHSAGGYLDDIGPRLAREFLARDVLLRPLGNVVYVLPPLAMTDDELHRVHDVITDVFREIG